MTSSGPLDIYEKFYEPGLPSHQQPNVTAGSKALAQLIINAPDASDAIAESVDDIAAFGCKRPPALDYTIRMFDGAADLLPDTVSTNYGRGPQAARDQLYWWLIDSSRFFQGDVEPGDVGEETTRDCTADDASNVNFQGQGMKKIEKVLEKLRNFQASRRESIVHFALHGQCHALNAARLNRGRFDGEYAVALIDRSLHPPPQPPLYWSKVDFVANCVLLRGCAKGLLNTIPSEEMEEKLQGWQEGYTEFLRSDMDEGQERKNKDNDFVLKAHAAMVLENLTKGPRDESSNELFEVTNWVF